MSETFMIADTHFGDTNIITYENRPFSSVEDMDEKMITLWNSVVHEDDVVFHLGDVGSYPLLKMQEIIKQLNGKKILIMGNHDSYLTLREWMECGFEEVYKYSIIYNEFIVMQHQPPQYINSSTPFFYLYGHVHGTDMYPTVTEQSACVSVERWNYIPVEFGQLKKYVDELPK
ncbi:metallophosphoesterase [Clostridium beijerinckii]|jgi:Predicted phosphoesterase or phosphohydrolase|uniref:Metallophosphoesterase n=2 Tax=Clostridium beijerinckii TaxID=1520 RepID=A0AAE2RUZ9_CLOBE|nr:metallophosphoesterase [Clostridium beijerinckii]ABR34778.1 conserved hypothetical protein [Clostridium beijerinckii NCIMB 8052]AIU00759.1 hypothetical protein Cbs_2624 [Clostridium beijerinckii ATCC 35702]MBF7810591.1 metallophosphoesterase [Clostridium beijerinckii]NOW91310.1 calcineurin-like phosphoesterase family protein [Clostridium beijerinckii]NRT23868.1 calcineurin-like phosphoesterase family protein [Clostridium beijerinckii]